MDDSRDKHSKALSSGSGLAALIAFIACNGLSLIVAAFSFFGVVIAVGPHLQAATITAFVLLSLGFIGLAYWKYRAPGPFLLSVVGTSLVVGTLYIEYSKTVESVGLVALVAAALWNWRASKICVSAKRSSKFRG